MGDLNELGNPSEKLPVHQGNSTRHSKFKKFIQLGLIDLGAMGLPFTWYNKRIDSGAIFECLDQVLYLTNC